MGTTSACVLDAEQRDRKTCKTKRAPQDQDEASGAAPLPTKKWLVTPSTSGDSSPCAAATAAAKLARRARLGLHQITPIAMARTQ